MQLAEDPIRKRGCLIFARTSSARLPGKALLPLDGEAGLLECVVRQVRKVKATTVIATSTGSEDDAIAALGEKLGVEVFRGDLMNVAARTAACLEKYNFSYFARVNGDSPFLSPELLSEGFRLLEEEGLDMITNIFPRSYPYGYSLEVIRSETFLKALASFNTEEQEHITAYFYKNSSRFRIRNLTWDKGPADPGIILTVDDRAGYLNIRHLFEKYPSCQQFSLDQLITSYQSVLINS